MLKKKAPIQITLNVDLGTNRDDLKIFCEEFIENYNETWDTDYQYKDLLEEKDESRFIMNVKEYLNDALEDILAQESGDEFLNYLNYRLNKLKNKKELGL